MSFFRCKVILVCLTAAVAPLRAKAVNTDEKSDRIAALEARLSELEVRLSEIEQRENPGADEAKKRIEELEARLAAAEHKAKIAEQLAIDNALKAERFEKADRVGEISNYSNVETLLWTDEQRWAGVAPGVSIEKVVELLGPPLRSVDSLKPRVDQVFYYQGSLRASSGSLRGKVSFRDGEVLAVEKPNFEQNSSAQN